MSTGVGIEDQVAAAFIDNQLTPDTQFQAACPGGLWDGPAPGTNVRPFGRFQMQSQITVRGVGQVVIMVNMLWIVTADTEGSSYAPLRAGAARIQSLLHGLQEVAVADPSGLIVTSTWEGPFHQEGVMAGREFRRLGGIFRIYAQGS